MPKVSEFPTDTAPSGSDLFPFVDVSAARTEVVTLTNLIAAIGGGGGGDMTAAEILAALLTVDGSGSGLDADLLDGNSSAAFLKLAAGGASVEDVGAIESNLVDHPSPGSTETIDCSVAAFHTLPLSANCTVTFSNPAPSGKVTMITVEVSGSYTVTWPASVKWPDGEEPLYSSPALFTFYTRDAGTTWLGGSAGKAYS